MGPLPPPTRRSGPCAWLPAPSLNVPQPQAGPVPCLPTVCQTSSPPRAPVSSRSRVSCISTRAQTACPPGPSSRPLVPAPFVVALGSRFVSIHVLPALSGRKASVVSDATLILSRERGGGHWCTEKGGPVASALAIFLWVSGRGPLQGFGWWQAGYLSRLRSTRTSVSGLQGDPPAQGVRVRTRTGEEACDPTSPAAQLQRLQSFLPRHPR